MAFKIALDAGHGLNTAGKRCLKKLDPAQTREWWLNDRIADKIEKLLQDYTGYALIRVDDTTGKKDISRSNRIKKANSYKADFYLSIHHNAGIKGGSGGGIVAYVCKGAQAASVAWRDALYKALIDATWLKGNRADPLLEKNFDVVKKTTMPAVLLELGFMDSSTDVPIILTEEYADQCAGAIVKVLAQKGKLTKEAVQPEQEYTLDQFIRQVQKAIGAAVDGKPGPETMSKTVTVSEDQNDNHPVVKPIQRRLTALGYTQVGKVDGYAGPKFTAAVKAFQEDHDCWRDGIITAKNKTWRKLLGKE